MRKQWLGVAAAALLGGCAVVENVNYPVTSFAEIPLKNNAKIKVVANTPAAGDIAAALKEAFGKSKTCKVVESEPDYWFVIDKVAQDKSGVETKTVSVVSQETGDGRQEMLQPGTLQISSAAQGVSVSVYETRTLSPLHYLEVPMYDGDLKAKARTPVDYEKAFWADAVERVKDAFLTQEKKVDIPVPLKASSNYLKLMAAGKYAEIIKQYEAQKIDVRKINAEMVAGTYKGELKADAMFADYAVYLLARETQTTDPDELAQLRTDHLYVIENCEDEGLAVAVPVALARLDYKLAHLGE